jgi:hypothetical protein
MDIHSVVASGLSCAQSIGSDDLSGIGHPDGSIKQQAPIISYLRVVPYDAVIGIEPQRAAIADLIHSRGFDHVAEFVEVGAESAADGLDLRPVLARAIRYARDLKCPVAIADLDRLGREHSFIAELVATQVQFIITGPRPGAQPLTLSAYAVSGGQQGEPASRRHKENRANDNLLDVARQLRASRAKARADRFAVQMLPLIKPLREEGASLQKIAAILNRRGVPTANGGAWSAERIRAILLRIEQIEQDQRAEEPNHPVAAE